MSTHLENDLIKIDYLDTKGLEYVIKKVKDMADQRYKMKTISLLASDWSKNGDSYSITVQVDGINKNSDIQIIPKEDWTSEQRQAWVITEILSGSQDVNSITLIANGSKPIVDLTINILIGSDVIVQN